MTQVPRFYSRQLGKTVAALIEEQLGRNPSEQLSLLEELAVMRQTASTACALYDGALKAGKTEMVAEATCLLRDAMHQVRVMCEAAARVDALGRDKLSVHSIAFVIQQIVKIAWRVFGEDDERVALFEQMLRDEVRIPGASEPQGTELLPGADAIDMDDTVPSAPILESLTIEVETECGDHIIHE